MSTHFEQWRDLSEAEQWRAALIAGLFPERPSDEALAAIADAVRLMRKKSSDDCHVT